MTVGDQTTGSNKKFSLMQEIFATRSESPAWGTGGDGNQYPYRIGQQSHSSRAVSGPGIFLRGVTNKHAVYRWSQKIGYSR